MDKLAKTTDPIQLKLRDHKKRWNIAAKEFKKRISALSRTLNGRGEPTYGLPPTDIKEPLPNELASFLSELAGNFQQLAEEASRIQQEQDEYSHGIITRRQEREQKMQQELPAPAPAKIATASSKAKLNIGGKTFSTLIAITSDEQEAGLMHQPWPPPVMSFVYSSPRVNRFWMKQTPSPLDIVFSLNGKITAIHKGEPFSTQAIGDFSFSDLVVELPYGTCAQLGIKANDSIILEDL